MNDRMRNALLLGVLGVGAVETASATCVYRDALDDEDWEAARAAVEALPAGEPVIFAQDWLGPRARMAIPALGRLDVVGRPDLRGLPRFHVLGLGARWSDRLDEELEDLPRPTEAGDTEAGALRLTSYASAAAGTLVADLTAAALEVETDEGACRNQGNRWLCAEGTVSVRIAEVSYHPRRCLVLDVEDGTHVRITAEGVTGTRLRGHVGFHDFNGRLRSDAPVSLGVLVDGTERARLTVTDEEGWRPFALALPEGTHRVTLDAFVTVRGTWWRGSHLPNKPRPACVELRALQEGGA